MFKKLFSGSAQRAGQVASLYKPSTIKAHSWLWRIGLAIATLLLINVVLMIWWSVLPAPTTPKAAMQHYLTDAKIYTKDKKVKPGTALTAITMHMIDDLLNKNGGYLRNDVTPPGILMDNAPSWEYGVLTNLRNTAIVYRDDFATSGTQTKIDDDLKELVNKLNIESQNWMFPSPEESYDEAGKALRRYFDRITDDHDAGAQFYARADNLQKFIDIISQNLGSYSQRLSESTGIKSEDLGLAGDASAEQTTKAPKQIFNKTPWYKIDDTFYEARGYTWALLQEMRAIQVDFKSVLEDKNASMYVQQIILELEASQATVWSPIILNGSGFGLVANHSKVMAAHVSRVNTILGELSRLLENG